MAIKIRISPNRLGHLTLKPVSDRVHQRIAKSNQYNHMAEVYLQTDVCVDELVNSLSYAQRRTVKRGYEIRILMDEWTYRHQYVGGQTN